MTLRVKDVIGHSISQEDGMRVVAPWLQARIPEVPVTFVPAGNPVKIM